MAFRTDAVTIDGERFALRELNGFAVELAQDQPSEVRQGYALVALSLVDETGAPLYSSLNLGDGIDLVMGLPSRVSQALSEAVTQLNAGSMDDARKN